MPKSKKSQIPFLPILGFWIFGIFENRHFGDLCDPGFWGPDQSRLRKCSDYYQRWALSWGPPLGSPQFWRFFVIFWHFCDRPWKLPLGDLQQGLNIIILSRGLHRGLHCSAIFCDFFHFFSWFFSFRSRNESWKSEARHALYYDQSSDSFQDRADFGGTFFSHFFSFFAFFWL